MPAVKEIQVIGLQDNQETDERMSQTWFTQTQTRGSQSATFELIPRLRILFLMSGHINLTVIKCCLILQLEILKIYTI